MQGVTRMSEIAADQRPRERLLRLGSHALTDAELVAVLMGTGRPGENALALAHRLLADYGGLGGLAATRPQQLAKVAGVGSAKAARLAAGLALADRSRTTHDVAVIRATGDLVPVVQPLLQGLHHERLVAVVCDRRLRVREVLPVVNGCSDSATLPVRDVLSLVFRHDGHAFAVAHNHPTGDPTPSAADRKATEQLTAAADAAGLRFLGHLVLGDSEWRTA